MSNISYETKALYEEEIGCLEDPGACLRISSQVFGYELMTAH